MHSEKQILTWDHKTLRSLTPTEPKEPPLKQSVLKET